jgi:hypothetical protein
VATSKPDAAIDAAEHISGVDFLQVEGDPFAAGAGADKGAEPQIAAKRAIDAIAPPLPLRERVLRARLPFDVDQYVTSFAL